MKKGITDKMSRKSCLAWSLRLQWEIKNRMNCYLNLESSCQF